MDLSPIENKAMPFFRNLGLALLATGLVLAVGPTLFQMGLAGPSVSTGPVLLVAVAFVMLLFAFVFLYGYRIAPTSLAVDDRGFTLRYRDGRSEGFLWDEVAAVLRPAELVGMRESKNYEGIMLALVNGQVVTVSFASTEMAEAIEKGKKAHPRWSGKANLKQALLFLKAIQRMTAGPKAIRVAEMIRAFEERDAPAAGK